MTRTLPINGAVRPLGENNPACWADRYPCTIYEFTLAQEGPIDITLAWEGHPRALLVQLYWGDGAIAHEAVAPRDGPPQIAFVRPRMEASLYRVRVVSLEPAETIPYVLTIAY